jgi:N-acetylglucosamine malate deacetylase 1
MKTILAIGAHPDDIEIGCGGTLALFAEKDYKIIHLIVTSGEEGDLLVPKAELAVQREHEAKGAARVLGASGAFFMREPDGLTSFSKATKMKLISLLREIRPETVFTHSSSDHFPDHKIAHELVRAALLAASGPWYQEAGGAPHDVANVYGYEVWHPLTQPQMSIDISRTFEKKIEALRQHASQVGRIDYVEAVRGLALYRGAMTGVGKFAEVFEVLKTSIPAIAW